MLRLYKNSSCVSASPSEATTLLPGGRNCWENSSDSGFVAVPSLEKRPLLPWHQSLGLVKKCLNTEPISQRTRLTRGHAHFSEHSQRKWHLVLNSPLHTCWSTHTCSSVHQNNWRCNIPYRSGAWVDIHVESSRGTCTCHMSSHQLLLEEDHLTHSTWPESWFHSNKKKKKKHLSLRLGPDPEWFQTWFECHPKN